MTGYYQQGTERAKKVNELFSSIAARYDLINDLQSFGLHRAWKRRLIRLSAVAAGEPVVDVCCGTGDLAFLLADRGGVVTGVDFTAAMLAQAERRATSRSGGGTKPRFIQGDALALPCETSAFSCATMAYGLRNLASFEGGIAELWRVLAPGGRLLILDFGRPSNRVWRWFYFLYLRWAIPVLGWLFCGDRQAYAYILESLERYPGQHGVRDLLVAQGFERCEIHELLWGVMSIHVAHKPR